jgi:hypothetical protein
VHDRTDSTDALRDQRHIAILPPDQHSLDQADPFLHFKLSRPDIAIYYASHKTGMSFHFCNVIYLDIHSLIIKQI